MARITRIDTAWRNRGILHNIVCYESKGNRTNSTHPSSVSWKWSTADGPPTRTTSPLSSNGTPNNGNRVNNANGDDAGEYLEQSLSYSHLTIIFPTPDSGNNNEVRRTVSLLSSEDGRPDIVQAARTIAERVSSGEIAGLC